MVEPTAAVTTTTTTTEKTMTNDENLTADELFEHYDFFSGVCVCVYVHHNHTRA